MLYALTSSWGKFANVLPVRGMCLTSRLQKRFIKEEEEACGEGGGHRRGAGSMAGYGGGMGGRGGATHGERSSTARVTNTRHMNVTENRIRCCYILMRTRVGISPLEVGTSKPHPAPHAPPRTRTQVCMLGGSQQKRVRVSPRAELANTSSRDDALGWARVSNVLTPGQSPPLGRGGGRPPAHCATSAL